MNRNEAPMDKKVKLWKKDLRTIEEMIKNDTLTEEVIDDRNVLPYLSDNLRLFYKRELSLKKSLEKRANITKEELNKSYPSMKDMRDAYQAKERIESIKKQQHDKTGIKIALSNLKYEFIDARENARRELTEIMNKGRCELDSIERAMKQYTDEITIIDIELKKYEDGKKKTLRRQNAWKGLLKDSFKDFLSDLSQIGYTSRNSADNWENIFKDQFSDNNLYCGLDNRIEWDGTWIQYDEFYSKCHEYKLFTGLDVPSSSTGAQGVFFEAHCAKFKRGKYEIKTSAQVTKGIDSGRSVSNFTNEEKDKLDQLFQKYPTKK